MKNRIGIIRILIVLVFLFLPGCGDIPDKQDEQKPEVKYPTRQINCVIQSQTDSIARSIVIEVQKSIGVPIVFINKPDAAGVALMSYLKSSAPDGYTIGYVSTELSMVKALGYSPDIDPNSFDLIASSEMSPAVIIVNTDSPFKTLKDLADYAKVNPDKLRIGNPGENSIWHIAAFSFGSAAGVKFSHAAFDGSASAIKALMGGRVDAVSVSEMELRSNAEGRKLKALTVLSDRRSEYMPDIPTAKELGYDVSIVSWGGFAAPKGLPQEVKDVLYPAFEKAISSKSFRDTAKSSGFSVFFNKSNDFAAYANSQYEFYMKHIPAMGLKK